MKLKFLLLLVLATKSSLTTGTNAFDHQSMTDSCTRINAGGSAYTDKLGYSWEGDSDNAYYNGGHVFRRDLEISGTEDDMLYPRIIALVIWTVNLSDPSSVSAW
jgi:hypothetical protein